MRTTTNTAAARLRCNLIHILSDAFPWECKFEIAIKIDDDAPGGPFDAEISHPYFGVTQVFRFAVEDDGSLSINAAEDCWSPLTEKTLMAYMWSDLADQLKTRTARDA